jgi:hypothetical protein
MKIQIVSLEMKIQIVSLEMKIQIVSVQHENTTLFCKTKHI